MKTTSADAALQAIPAGARVVLPHGAVELTALYEAVQRRPDELRGVTFYSGLQFGSYSFLNEGLGRNFEYVTWQASAKLRPLFRERRIELLPLRFRDVVRNVRRGGPVEPDVAFIQVAPPRSGKVNLGISCSLYPDFIRNARLVIAEIHPEMPWTHGATEVDAKDVDLAVESTYPIGTYRSPRQSERDARIVDRVLGLIPEDAWVQLGVGAIPDAILPRLAEIPRVNLHSGMLSDGLVEFLGNVRHRAGVVTGEVAGSPELYRALAENDRVQFQPSTTTHDLRHLATLPRFTSVNSAVEVDLHGQINGETIDGVQISGVGGALDFVEGATYAEGGMSILALPSTTEDGKRSKIVRALSAATPVTIPRFCADVIVTEHGVARLRGRTLRERAEMLVEIAHPDFRSALGEGL